MKARYDAETIVLSDRYVAALIEVMRAECEMMAPHHPGCWEWGRCYVGDLARNDGLSFEYGANDDAPGDGLGDFAVVVLDTEGSSDGT